MAFGTLIRITYKAALLVCCLAPCLALSGPAPVEQWRVQEIELHSSKVYPDPFFAIEVNVRFVGPAGQVLVRPAFWDGGDIWRVRFAPPAIGHWSYKTECSDLSNNGLIGQRGGFECVSYKGALSVYRHGFLQVAQGQRYLEHRDGTPFFWLADTHWLWEKERLGESNKPGWTSQFKGMVDRRIQQGFSVYQVELFGRWRDALLGGSVGNRQTTLDLDHFRKDVDPKWKYLADQGMVVATTLGILPKDVSEAQGRNEARMARYVCARYGAYPAVWLMYQECTANLHQQFTGEAQRAAYMNVVRTIGHAFKNADCYHHPRTAHSDSSIVTAYRGEDWLDMTMFQGGHGKTFYNDRYYGFYFDANFTLPQIEGEANYERLFDGSDENQSMLVTTDAMRSKAYRAIQCGCCGYTYGAGGVWQATWDNERTGNQTVYGTTPWRDGIDLPGGEQLKHLKKFYSSLPWETLLPRPECDGFLDGIPNLPSSQRPAVSSDRSCSIVVVYFDSGTPYPFAVNHLLNSVYTVQWMNPRSGEYSTIPGHISPLAGAWQCMGKPDGEDWVLLLRSSGPPEKGVPLVGSRWWEIQAERATDRIKNLAIKAKIVASSTDTANKVYSAQSAIDGNIDTTEWRHWSNDAASDPAKADKPCWLELEWPSEVTIQKLVLYTMEGYEVSDFRFEYADQQGWKTVPETSISGNRATRWARLLAKPITTRKIRFVGMRGPAIQPEIVRVVEVQAISK